MSTLKTQHPSCEKSLNELRSARDATRVQLHLLSMEALERWQALETKLSALERELVQGGEKAAEAAADRVRDLVRAARSFRQRHAEGASGH